MDLPRVGGWVGGWVGVGVLVRDPWAWRARPACGRFLPSRRGRAPRRERPACLPSLRCFGPSGRAQEGPSGSRRRAALPRLAGAPCRSAHAGLVARFGGHPCARKKVPRARARGETSPVHVARRNGPRARGEYFPVHVHAEKSPPCTRGTILGGQQCTRRGNVGWTASEFRQRSHGVSNHGVSSHGVLSHGVSSHGVSTHEF